MSPISNMLVQLKNGQAVGKESVSVPFSKVKFSIAGILRDEQFISSVERRKKKIRNGSEHEYIEIGLKYGVDGEGAIGGIKIISKPSRHIYSKASEIRPVRSGYGVAIISTSKGIMTSREARKHNLGGELMFEIY